MAGPPDALVAALERLYGRERGNKGPFTLAGTRALLDELGRPEERFLAIHIAGTNGKGSTAAMIERCVRATRAKTGLFTSPHLVDFRERIRVNGRWADAAPTAERLDRIAALPASPGRTFFEATFALGALTFAEEKVDMAVLETGLGGRLDSTNVVTPQLAVITPIGLDHRELLGDTLAAIAREKAGIAKPGRSLVVAPQDPAAYDVIAAHALAVGAPLIDVSEVTRVTAVHRLDRDGAYFTIEVRGWGEFPVHLGLLGRHQMENALTAVSALRQSGEDWSRGIYARLGFEPHHVGVRAVQDGLAHARWPGRFESSQNERRLFWDGAHNAEGAQVLRDAWRDVLLDPPAAVVLGFATDKDACAMVGALQGPVKRVFAVAADSPRAATPDEVARIVRERLPGIPVTACASVAEGVQKALASLGPGEFALACGSLFVVGEAMQAMGEGEIECL